MIISYNKHNAEIRDFDGDKAISLRDLVKLSGQVSLYKKLQKNFKLNKYKKGKNKKDICLTLNGCVELLSDFIQPNDGLINEIKKIKERFDVKEPSFEKKIPAEQLIDLEMKRLDNEKLDFEDLKQRFSNLEVKTNDIVAGLSISQSQFKERIEDLENKLEDVENKLSYLNDKPKQQDTSFRTLLKECIKEIIREELQK